MSKKVKFGTDGWRGIIADDFTFDNVRMVSGAISDYINAHDMGEHGVVVGYDNRFMSDKFADVVSDILVENSIPVYITESSTPTPVTAYGVKSRNASGAVMITASHNPPEYNGIKFIPEYAGPALPEITKEIEENINKQQGGPETISANNMNYEAASTLAEKTAVEAATKSFINDMHKEKAEKKKVNLFDDYSQHIRELVDVKAIKNAGLKLVVDPMYGCGAGYLERLLREAGVDVIEIECCRDPLFGGSLPEPSKEHLGDLRKWVTEEKAHMGLAMDGDADRFGIIDQDGSYVSANQFLPIIYYHLLKSRGITGPVTRTVATTHLLDRMAKRYGQEVFETPVGFKYIGENLRKKGCALGGEESGGLSIKGHIPEKDGVLAGLLAAEIIAVHQKNLDELTSELHEEFGPVYSKRVDIKTTPKEKEKILAEIRDFAPRELAGSEVTLRTSVDGVKLVLQDNSWVLIRPSGTEPVFRVYAEAKDESRVKELQKEFCRKLGLEAQNI
ncbi:MAG: phosphoglucomutase/phosphomannomutase family protein [Clostridiales bacterium]|nr:phosphoglucomutase/phosphomannomutase family protein [Clostridiales bacterium]MCF8022908.1 phosphoglucomutase/phosphomannomutase family protein [Clostridiales bacterium]